jgi:predicted N-acetyltransferase YhbS
VHSTVIRPATRADLPALHPVIERAYRGEASRVGWTHEADLVEGARTDIATLTGLIEAPGSALLIALDGEAVLGCVNVASRGDGLAYLGLLCVEPRLQSSGTGGRLVDAAETLARDTYGAHRMEMTVIDRRSELMAWYVRRGYAATGERRDFPVPMTPPLFLAVLAKPL